MSWSEFQISEVDEAKIPDKVDAATFVRLCNTVLGIKND
jgi:hypothetical protein